MLDFGLCDDEYRFHVVLTWLRPSLLAVPRRWVEAVFSLVGAVVGVQHGAAAMTECGLIPALLNVVQLNMDGQVSEREDADVVSRC